MGLAVLSLLSLAAQATAAETATEVYLPSDFDLQVMRFASDNEALLIWLPSIYGVRSGHTDFGQKVQREGIDVWLVDLHESYLEPTGRYSYELFEPQHVKELIDHAVRQGRRNIVLGGEGHAASLALRAARLWQVENPGNEALEGLLLYYPYLIDGYTEIGQKARFRPIARATNLPVYIFQPQYNTKYIYIQDLIAQLRQGGAPVYFHPLKGVRGGFHVRDVDRLHSAEMKERDRVGRRVRAAVSLLVRSPTPERAAAPVHDDPPIDKVAVDRSSGLTRLDRDEAPPLRLFDEHGQVFDLDDHQGEVVLVNFWASWCGPCIREIASLMRLIEHFEDRPFRVVAVNTGESKADVAAFFERLEITPNFQVLFDPDAKAANAWRVYAIPSNYLLDKRHRLRFGYRGALEWDDPEIVEIVRGLLE